MLRTILFILILFNSLISQDSKEYSFGLKFGFNFSHITGGYSYGKLNNAHKKPGINFGFIFHKRINELTSLQAEILYNEMGSKWGQPLICSVYDSDYAIYKFKYITIPVYYKCKSKIGNLIKDFDFVIGACYSYNFMAKQTWVVEVYDYTLDVGPSDIRNEINIHEIGIIYGIKIPFKNRKYYLNFLFYNAISKIYHSTYKGYVNDFMDKNEFRNNTFSISFDYFLW